MDGTIKIIRVGCFPVQVEKVEVQGGVGPDSRYGHSMVYFSKIFKIIIYGGKDGVGNIYQDAFMFDVRDCQWTQLHYSNDLLSFQLKYM